MEISNHTYKSLPLLETILVLGNGGRENALAWALKKCPEVKKVLVAPGNGGTENHNGCFRLDIKANDLDKLITECAQRKINLIVIGPELPLALGLADKLRKAGLTVFGPGADGAQIEASKSWAKELMRSAYVPTAKSWTASSKNDALKVLKEQKKPLVVKANGLAAGKGVTVAENIEETRVAINEAFEGKFGLAGASLVLEERLEGPEVSVFALCDGEKMILLPTAQDHKRLKEGDKGPNTGGMGAYAPAPLLSQQDLINVKETILQPTIEALIKRGINYRGVLYAGLMLTKAGPYVIEFNCRFGDPECQTLMPLMGKELAKILQACALGCLEIAPKLMPNQFYSACVVAAASGYPESPEKGKVINIEIESDEKRNIFHAGTEIDKNLKLVTSGGRVLSVVGVGEDFDKAFENAYQGLDKIYFEGISFRNDIGYQVRKDKYSK